MKKERGAGVRFQPGKSGNEATKFQPGQSGNPAGKSALRIRFDQALAEALVGEGTPEELAKILWTSVRAGEAWAMQTLLQRLAPQAQSLKLIHERGIDQDEIDYTRLTEEQIQQLRAILEPTACNALRIES